MRADDFDTIAAICKSVYPHETPYTEQELAAHHRVYPQGQFVAEHLPTRTVAGAHFTLCLAMPDFHLDDWLASIDRIEASAPRRLFSTHYGFHEDPATQFADLRQGLHDWTEAARRLLMEDLPDEVRADRFDEHVTQWLSGKADPAAVQGAREFSGFRASYHGLAWYWKKKLG